MEISKEIIALWGAGLSTLLAFIKVWEVWSSRRRIEVSYSFIGFLIPPLITALDSTGHCNTPLI